MIILNCPYPWDVDIFAAAKLSVSFEILSFISVLSVAVFLGVLVSSSPYSSLGILQVHSLTGFFVMVFWLLCMGVGEFSLPYSSLGIFQVHSLTGFFVMVFCVVLWWSF